MLAGQYMIDKVLGQGGFGITYRAIDHKTGQKVAVKEFFPDALAYREGTTVISYPGERSENYIYGKENFLQEAQTLAEFIGNEGIVRIHSYFEENGTAYFVMDYIEGKSFDDYLKEKGGKISVEEAEEILVPVMDALGFVHSKGIVHRDVTPDNIYITHDGKVKLLDFGAARYSLGDKSRSLDVILKHGFAPKEQYTRRGKQGPFTDIYSLAATFYFALTGKRPPDSVERMDEDDLVPMSNLGVNIAVNKENAILRALSVQPADRFQSMADFKKAMIGENSATNQIFFTAPAAEAKPQEAQQQQAKPADYRHVEPESHTPEKSQSHLRNKKFIAMLIGGGVALAVISIAVLVVIAVQPRQVKDRPYEYIVSRVVSGDSQQMTYTGEYTGKWKSKMPYGQGKWTGIYENGDFTCDCYYDGEWKDGVPSGYGIQEYGNGQKYEGEFADGRPNGQGTLTYAEDDEANRRDYVGEWVDGKKNGQGVMTWKDGQKYEGEWKDDARNGQGTQTYAEDDKSHRRDYVGEWVDGKRNGQGVLTWKDGDKYEGEWKDGQRNGQATYTFADGSAVTGEWQDDKYIIKYDSGAVYMGGFNSKGNPSGQGTYTFADGTAITGEWQNGGYVIRYDDTKYKDVYVGSVDKNGNPSGEGTLTNNNGYSYKGEWKNGMYHGYGKQTWANGDIYEGEFVDGKRSGHGVYTWADGNVMEGEWKDGEFVK